MAILDIQKRARELGRIRIGDRVAAGKGDRPNKLDRPRLTSPSKALIENAARVYGGEVREWQSPAGPQWQVYVTSDAIDVILPPGEMALDQHYELWSGGGCQRRCDGEVDSINDGPCQCPDDAAIMQELAQNGEACKPTTRLKVILPKVGDLGLWRLETHGYHAAAELSGTLELLKRGGLGQTLLRGTLRIEQRTAKKPGVGTLRYIVPVLELADLNVDQLTTGQQTPAIAAPAARALPVSINQPAPEPTTRSLPAPIPPERPEDPKPTDAAAAKAAPPATSSSRRKRARKAEEAGPDTEAPSQPRANADGEELATPAQIRKLMVLSEKRGYSDEERRAAAGVASFKDLTKDRASKLIDEWENDENREDAAPAEPVGVATANPQREALINELIDLLQSTFTGPVARGRYRDTLLARCKVTSLEDLNFEQLVGETIALRERASA